MCIRDSLLAAVGGGRQGNAPVRMQVVDMFEGKEGMQRSVDGGGHRVVAEGAERVHGHHFIFDADAPVAVSYTHLDVYKRQA